MVFRIEVVTPSTDSLASVSGILYRDRAPGHPEIVIGLYSSSAFVLSVIVVISYSAADIYVGGSALDKDIVV